jgi:MoaA/NifB/PqqE/SkfB family radical SAM enzyme
MFAMQDKLIFNLEPTFRCNLGCEMCPRFSSEDSYLDMSMETFQLVCDSFDFAHTVDFTGWGEPLLHRNIYEMIRMARDHGCNTSMTSNGTALTAANANRLIESGLNSLTVSIDGLSPEVYDKIRVGASLEQVEVNLRETSRLIREQFSTLQLGVAFTIQELNAHEVARSADCGFLKYRLDPRDGDAGRLQRLETDMRSAASRARELGMAVSLDSELPLSRDLAPRHCLAAPLSSVYFSYEGRVSPCCHFGHHVSRFFEGQFYPPSALFYGDIRESSFEEIWNGGGFIDFRRGFEDAHYPQQCRSCYLLYGK